MFFNNDETSALQVDVERLVNLSIEKGVILSTAESCTGGLIGAMITAVSGSSKMYYGGIVAYSNDLKMNLLGVSPETLKGFGAVSAETASEMALGMRKQIAKIGDHYEPIPFTVSVTGLAGPTGGTPEKPVGLVYCAFLDSTGNVIVKKYNFNGDRHNIRVSTVKSVIQFLLDKIEAL